MLILLIMKCLLGLFGLTVSSVITEHHVALKTSNQVSRHHKRKHHKAKVHNGPDSPQDTKGLEQGVTDKEFFGPPHNSDYATDLAPPAVELHHMDYPYPAHKGSDESDQDFLEDSNTDGGAWDAQMRYDQLRAKLRTEKLDVVRAQSLLEAEDVKLDNAQEAEHVREEKRKKEEEKWRAKEEERNLLSQRLLGKSNEVSVQEARVDLLTQELQQAERDLQQTTGRLQQAQNDFRDAENGVQGLADARKLATAAKMKYDAAQKDELEAENIVDIEMSKHDQLAQKVQKEKDDVKRVEAEINYARMRLGDQARGSIDRSGDIGGVYRSSASTTSLTAVWLLLPHL